MQNNQRKYRKDAVFFKHYALSSINAICSNPVTSIEKTSFFEACLFLYPKRKYSFRIESIDYEVFGGMNMIDPKRWEMSKKRFEAFWNREILDRCLISITSMKDGGKPVQPVFRDEKYFTTPEIIIGHNRKCFQETYFAGEAYPIILHDLGAGGHAGFFKGEKHAFQDTVWFFPGIEHPDQVEFDENSFLYKKSIEIAKAFAEDSKGDYFVGMPDATGNADALAHLMGSENLMTAMLDEPEAVKRALKKIQYAYERIMNETHVILKDVNDGGGCVGWLRTWAPGFHAQMQCDMSVMISKGMFDEFIVQELSEQSKMLDYALYHFDGTEQIRHLDSLLGIPGIKAIQWTQVYGQPPCTEYIPVLKRIQEAGKNLVISVAPEQVMTLMENLSSKGLYLLTSVPTQYDADELMKLVSKWTHE